MINQMKTNTIFLIIGVLLFVPFASAHYLNIYEGWNLVPTGTTTDVLGQCPNTFLASFFYSPLDNQYFGGQIGSSITGTMANYSSYESTHITPSTVGSVVWMYASKGCQLDYELSTENAVNKKLFAGWNFLAVTPSYVGYSMNEVISDCDVEKFYNWNSFNQNWERVDITSPSMDNEIVSTGVGTNLIVKVAGECTLGKQEFSTPPQLP